MIDAVFPEARGLATVFSGVSKIVDEILLSFKKDGIHARAMDGAHLAMVDLFIPSDSFESYSVIDEANLGIKLDDVNNVLKRSNKSDKLGVGYDERENMLNLKFIGQIKREFSINLIELNENTPNMPKLPIEAKATVIPTVLKEAVKDVGTISDYAVFEADKNYFYIKSKSSKGSVTLEITKESGYLIDYEFSSDKPKVKASYGVKYLEYMTSIADDAASMVIGYSASAPLKMDYKIPNDVQLTFLLAPRAEED